MPERYIGTVMELCRERRGVETTFNYLAAKRVELTSQLPLADVLFDFYDRLKTITQGYGSFDYELLDYRETDLVKVDILVNGEPVDALSAVIIHTGQSPYEWRCRKVAEKLARNSFPRQLYADRHPGGTIGQGQVIARTNHFRRSARTSRPSATAATSRASASFWKSKKRARSG